MGNMCKDKNLESTKFIMSRKIGSVEMPREQDLLWINVQCSVVLQSLIN